MTKHIAHFLKGMLGYIYQNGNYFFPIEKALLLSGPADYCLDGVLSHCLTLTLGLYHFRKMTAGAVSLTLSWGAEEADIPHS